MGFALNLAITSRENLANKMQSTTSMLVFLRCVRKESWYYYCSLGHGSLSVSAVFLESGFRVGLANYSGQTKYRLGKNLGASTIHNGWFTKASSLERLGEMHEVPTVQRHRWCGSGTVSGHYCSVSVPPTLG